MINVLTFFCVINILVGASYAQWIQMPSSPVGYIKNIINSEDALYLSHFNNGVFKSVDGGNSWQQINNGLNNSQSRSVSEILCMGDTLYAATVDGIYKSTNGGDSWEKKSNGITIGQGAIYEFCESLFEYNGSLFTGAWNGIYSSTDGAENWTVTNITGQGINAKNFVNHNGILFAARENINFPNGYTSVDNGITWNPLTSISGPVITFLSEPPKLWAGTIFGVWLSTDSGENWEMRNNGLNPDPYSSCIIRINGNLVTSLKFGGSGLFRSSDDGNNWESWDDGLPFLNSIEKLIRYDDKIIAATSNGLWQRDTTEVVTNVDNEINFPVNFELSQNYPNPFNPNTAIKFSVPIAGKVTLSVFNILGEKVVSLVDGIKEVGSYKINFDASKLPSGTYLYQLRSGSFIETKKMILMK